MLTPHDLFNELDQIQTLLTNSRESTGITAALLRVRELAKQFKPARAGVEPEWIPVNWVKDAEGDIDVYGDATNEALSNAAWAPGNLIRLKSGEVHLVGTINTSTGTCGCCNVNRYDVEAYAIPFPTLALMIPQK